MISFVSRGMKDLPEVFTLQCCPVRTFKHCYQKTFFEAKLHIRIFSRTKINVCMQITCTYVFLYQLIQSG